MLPSVLIIKVSSPFIPLAPCQLSDASHEDALDDDHVIVTSSFTKTFIGSAEIETFGSALKGVNFKDGNCSSWYVAEMAEKRAMSRAVLKLTGFYELGVFGEDESDSFKK